MNKKKAITIMSIITAICLVVAISVTSLVHIFNYYQLPQSEGQLSTKARQILLMNRDSVDLGVKSEPKRIIDNSHPMNLLNYYGNEDILTLWSSIPDNQKPFTIMLIIPGHCLLPNSDTAIDSLERDADICEVNRIPYAIQNINGEYHSEERMPIAYLEQRFAAKHEYFYGLNAAELYNGVDWRGNLESDQSQYIIDCIKLSAKYGAFFIWTDTNRGYENGMLLEWLENNENFYSTFKNYSKYICLLNKESFGVPSTYGIMQGLWLAGLVGNWGVASDWWHWQVDGDKKSLFGEFDKYVDNEWDMILSFPENMYVQSMMLVMSRGGTCFKAEAPNFSTSIGGVPVGGYEYGISPMLDRLIGGDIRISDKNTVLKETKAVIIGGSNWVDEFNYDFNDSNLYPNSGEAGIIPLLPSNLRLDERAVFLTLGIPLIDYKLNEAQYRGIWGNDSRSNTYITASGNNWYYINNVENRKENRYANFQPRISSASNVKITTAEHTSAIINESSANLSFYISNYRTDKSNMIKELTKESWDNASGWVEICGKYLPIDANGNPIGVDDSALRRVEIVINGSYNGGRPKVIMKSNIDGSGDNGRPFTYTESWNETSEELTITIMQNGVVEFDISVDDSGKTLNYVERDIINDSIKPNNNCIDKLSELMVNNITDSNNYTYYSYLNYARAVANAEMLISERTGSIADVDLAVKELVNAREQLINIEDAMKLLGSAILRIDDTMGGIAIGKSYDRLLREVLSVNKYVAGRSNKLGYAEGYKISKAERELVKKADYINKYYVALQELISK